MNIIKANVAAPDARVAITIARFNQFISTTPRDDGVLALAREGQVHHENATVACRPCA